MTANNYLILSLLFIVSGISVFAAERAPEWLYSIPYEKESFMGVGSGYTSEEAMENARIDILMQLSSKVDSTIALTEDSASRDREVVQLCKTVITSNSLRGAEVADSYENDGIQYILLRYCDSCGSILVASALRSVTEAVIERETNSPSGNEAEGEGIPEDSPVDNGAVIDFLDIEAILKNIGSAESSEAVKLKRELQGPAVPLIRLPEPAAAMEQEDPEEVLGTERYSTENILISSSEGTVLIRLIHFLPNTGDLTDQQIRDLESLSDTLFKQLEKTGYTQVDIVGHANPEGRSDEAEELEALSKERAVTMEEYLRKSGVRIGSVDWKGGRELIGSVDTEEGRGMNRRVDLYVRF